MRMGKIQPSQRAYPDRGAGEETSCSGKSKEIKGSGGSDYDFGWLIEERLL
jgi:hypothetical protein